MAVSRQDRDDFERGQRDRELNTFDRAVNDITVQHPDTAAYYKGRDNEQLDADKKSK